MTHCSSEVAGISGEQFGATEEHEEESSGQTEKTKHQLLQSWICLHTTHSNREALQQASLSVDVS